MIAIARSPLRHLLASGALVLGCATIVHAESSSAATTSVLGVRVSFDARGRLVPPPPEIVQQLRAAVSSTYAATREAHVPAALAGARSVVPDERHAAFSIARVDESGRVVTRCVAGAANAEAELAAVAASREEE
jgi:hypothetical protein